MVRAIRTKAGVNRAIKATRDKGALVGAIRVGTSNRTIKVALGRAIKARAGTNNRAIRIRISRAIRVALDRAARVNGDSRAINPVRDRERSSRVPFIRHVRRLGNRWIRLSISLLIKFQVVNSTASKPKMLRIAVSMP